MLFIMTLGSILFLFGLGSFFRSTPLAKSILARLDGREPAIDGLRGLSALLVTLHHFNLMMYMKSTGAWTVPSTETASGPLGTSGVAFFFLICAYLFWGRLASGRAYDAKIWTFFMNRVRRLVPMYLFAMTAAIILVGYVDEGFVIHPAWPPLFYDLLRCYSFDFFGTPHLNDSFLAYAAISVSWTLRLEWMFYATLPILAFTRIRKFWYIALPLALALNEYRLHIDWVSYFIYGALISELTLLPGIRRILTLHVFGLIFIVGFVFVCMSNVYPTGGWSALVLSIAFLPIASGNTLFGLLTNRAARILGAISYSVYLLNITVSAQVFKFLPAMLVDMKWGYIAAAMTGTALAVITTSLMTYLWIEVPFQKSHKNRPAPGLRDKTQLI